MALPEEDACILFRYAEHLASSGRISYNLGGPPTEGATDFLYLCLLAGWRALGGSTFSGSLVINGLSGVALLLLLRPAGGRALPALLLLPILPQTMAAVKGFSPLLLMALLLAAWRCYEAGRSRALLLTALAACLLRPDAALPAGLLLLAWGLRAWRKEERQGRLIALRQALLYFFLPGLAYFAWRMQYFGQLLPLPFYVKSQVAERLWGIFDPESLRANAFALGFDLLPVAALALLGGGRASLRRHGWLLLAYGAAPLLFYSLVSQAMNAGFRFQAPAYVAVWAWAAASWQGGRLKGRLGQLLLIALAMKGLYRQATIWQSIAADRPTQNIWRLSRDLAAFEGLHMAVSEAGRLPYYSGWRATDLWGLNDARYARRLVQPEDLAADPPDLIVLDPEDDALLEQPPPLRPFSARSWDHMVQNARLYAARSGGYEAWRIPFCRLEGSLPPWLFACPPRQDLYLLRTSLPQADSIRSVFRRRGGSPETRPILLKTLPP